MKTLANTAATWLVAPMKDYSTCNDYDFSNYSLINVQIDLDVILMNARRFLFWKFIPKKIRLAMGRIIIEVMYNYVLFNPVDLFSILDRETSGHLLNSLDPDFYIGSEAYVGYENVELMEKAIKDFFHYAKNLYSRLSEIDRACDYAQIFKSLN